ncbi:LytR/AlgR family response regulator transcription factor [Mucilaginibacter sp.]|uniref:LytR/AlgR family response regulator transcription factor n=1 Tax=Mucilaginibacter sp. TaxID=1882438 RepID=UPI003AFF74F0
MIKCVIIDDEQPAINVIEGFIKKMPNLELMGTATSPILGMELIKKHKAALVFLDIQMDEMNGIDVMQMLNPETKVIFCTAFSEFAVSSYELHALDYLLKPIPFNRFVKAVQRFTNETSASGDSGNGLIPNDYIFVKTEQKGKMIKIDLDDIDYIEAMSNYIFFHRGTQKTLVYLTIKELEVRLPAFQFIRVQKSYIVAIKQIMAIENGSLILKGRTERIPLGNNYKEAFMEKMKFKLMQH